MDGVVQEGEITSIYKTGLHRSRKEADKKNVFTMQLAGGNITYTDNHLKLGLTGYTISLIILLNLICGNIQNIICMAIDFIMPDWNTDTVGIAFLFRVKRHRKKRICYFKQDTVFSYAGCSFIAYLSLLCT